MELFLAIIMELIRGIVDAFIIENPIIPIALLLATGYGAIGNIVKN